MAANGVTSEGMIPLLNALSKGSQNLTKLDLNNNAKNYSESFIKYFCKFLENNKVVSELKISGNLSDKQAKIVAKSIGSNKGLEMIDLGPITEKQFNYMSANIQIFNKKVAIQ